MGTNPATPVRRQPNFSPDGMWWWDGREWKSALSPDGRWRWNGQSWVPSTQVARPGRGGAAAAALITVAAFAGVLVLVSLVVVVVLLTMGNQIANVFSNVAAALNSP